MQQNKIGPLMVPRAHGCFTQKPCSSTIAFYRTCVLNGILGCALACLSGCTLGSILKRKHHLVGDTFIPLNHSPQISPEDQHAITRPLPDTYAKHKRILADESTDLGPLGPTGTEPSLESEILSKNP
jgi:hypothetical protein